MRNLTILVLFLLAGQLLACCMVPRSYSGDVDQKGQKVLIMHHDGREELVLQVAPYFIDKQNQTPKSLAWLVTVPSKPLAYKVANEAVFDDARSLQDELDSVASSQKRSWFAMPTLSAGPFHEPLLEIGATVEVGPFEITSVKARGQKALDALNSYLSKRGFPTEGAWHMKWFVENEFTFLCINVTPPEGDSELGQALQLPPLQISFETEHPYYPGKYSARQGNFSLQMHALTSQPLDKRELQLVSVKLNSHMSNDYSNLWTERPLSDPLQEVVKDWKDKPARWYINTLTSKGFNDKPRGRPVVLDWEEDIFLKIGTDLDKPPSWYDGNYISTIWKVVVISILAVVGIISLYFIRKRKSNAKDATKKLKVE